MMPPCLTLSIIRYGSRVKWRNPEKGVAPLPTPWCSSYRKGSLRVTLDYGRQLYLLISPILLGRRMPGGDRILCKSTDVTYMIHRVHWPRIYHDWLILHRLCAMWTSSSVVEFRFCGRWFISSGEDYCW